MPRKKSSESPAHLSANLMPVEDPSVEYADGESSPHPDGVAEDDVMGGPSGRQPHAKRRCRPSKKDIPNYKFSEEQEKAVAEFVHEHSALYDKKDKRWCDPKFKEALWQEVAETFPDCSFLQVKKFFEMRRTDFGKIEKKANKSGSAARKLTPREEVVMATWGFLGGHIAHEPTQSSDRFSPTVSHRSSSSESGHSAHSIIRRRNLGMVKRKRTGTETTTHSSVPEDDDTTIKDLLNEAKKIMERRETTGVEAEIQDFTTYLCSRLRKVARRNHKVLFPQILELVSLLEEEPGDEVGEGKIDGEKVLSRHSTPQQPAQPPQQHYQPPQQQYQPPQQLYQPPQQPAQPPQQYQSPQQPAQPPQQYQPPQELYQPPQQYQPPQHPAQPPQQYQSPQQPYQPPQQQYQTPQQQYQPVYTVLSTPKQQIPPSPAPAPAAATVTTNPSPFTFPVSLEMMVPSVKSPSVASISSSKSVLETPKVTRPVDNLDSDEDDD